METNSKQTYNGKKNYALYEMFFFCENEIRAISKWYYTDKWKECQSPITISEEWHFLINNIQLSSENALWAFISLSVKKDIYPWAMAKSGISARFGI